MKNKIIIKSFFLLALMFSTPALASEVTGNLSSNGINNNQITGSISGSVVSTNTGGGGGGGSGGGIITSGGSSVPNQATGSVLGASTQQNDPPYRTSIISNDGNAVQTNPGTLAIATVGFIDEPSFVDVPVAEASASTMMEASTIKTGFNLSSWIWVIIALLAIMLVTYIYNNRDERKNKIQQNIK